MVSKTGARLMTMTMEGENFIVVSMRREMLTIDRGLWN